MKARVLIFNYSQNQTHCHTLAHVCRCVRKQNMFSSAVFVAEISREAIDRYTMKEAESTSP